MDVQGDQPGVKSCVELAEWIARCAHHGQKEESTGDDYIRHVERVVGMVDGDEAKAVAWLHDVIEDSPVSSGELREAGIPGFIVDTVCILTRVPPFNYEEYIGKILASKNKLAFYVKLADLEDHLRPNCPERLRARYERAKAALLAFLQEG